jgi:hypothetical protein
MFRRSGFVPYNKRCTYCCSSSNLFRPPLFVRSDWDIFSRIPTFRWYWVSESEIWEVAVDAEIDIEAKTLDVAAEAEDAEGIPMVTEDVDPMAAFTGCRLELRLPTS